MNVSEKHKKIIILCMLALAGFSYVAFWVTWNIMFFMVSIAIAMGALAINNFILYR